MLQARLADIALGIGIIPKPKIIAGSTCSELQEAIWSCYMMHRRDGLAPTYVRKAKGHTVRIYRFHCYVVKEYTGDTSKLTAEVDVLQQLHHDSLVGHLFIVDQGARLSIVMEWAGEGLRSSVAQQQPQQWGEDAARHIAFQLTNSLVYLHHKGIIHRDIKPDNIAVQPDLSVKLYDWGEALLLERLHSLTDKQLSKVAGVAGTPLFMPPEMLLYLTRSSQPSSCRSSSGKVAAAAAAGGDADADAEPCSHTCMPGRFARWGGALSPGTRRQPEQPRQQQQQPQQQPQSQSEQQSKQQQQSEQQAVPLRELTSPKLDVWGLGTVVFFLLAGRDILQADSAYDLHDMAEVLNASGGIQLPREVQASPAACDFLARCLARQPAKRATAKELLSHPWLAGCTAGTGAGAGGRALQGLSSAAGQGRKPEAPLLSPVLPQSPMISAHRDALAVFAPSGSGNGSGNGSSAPRAQCLAGSACAFE